MRRIVFERTGKNNGGLALWLDAFLYGLFDHANGGASTDIFPHLFAASRRKAANIPLDERLDGWYLKASNKDEREITRVGEPVFVKGERFFEVPFIDRLHCSHLPAQMISTEDVVKRLRQ